jgi:hypothetical protein
MRLARIFALAAVVAPAFCSAGAFATRDPAFNSLSGFTGFSAPQVIGNVSIFSSAKQISTLKQTIVKLRADGTPDPSWGDNGVAIGGGVPVPLADGKFLLIANGANSVMRVAANGRADPLYGPAGAGITPAPSAGTSFFLPVPASAWAVEPSGAVAIAGIKTPAPNTGVGPDALAFMRLDSQGLQSLPAFGSVLDTGIDLRKEEVYAWSMTTNGTVEVASYRKDASTVVPQVRRFEVAGSPAGQLVFGRVMPQRAQANWMSDLVKVDGFGRVLIAASGTRAELLRFNADGTRDAAFNAVNQEAPLIAVQVGNKFHSETLAALWAAPGGKWIQPSFITDFEILCVCPVPGNSTTSVVSIVDDAHRMVDAYEPFLAGFTSPFPTARLDDGSFMYLDVSAQLARAKVAPAFPRVEATIVEYYNPNVDQYFITIDGGETAILDATNPGGWKRTGYTFGAWMPVDVPGTVAACRFYGDFGTGTHFFTLQGPECDGLLAQPRGWRLEGMTFNAAPAKDGSCPGALLPVFRAYNNAGAHGGVPNHRYMVDTDAYREMQAKGWIGEGVAFCVPPETSRSNQRIVSTSP